MKVDTKTLAKQTIWITADPDGEGFIGVNYAGIVVARSKFKSQVEYKIRHDPVLMQTILAICTVVRPSDRQPERVRSERNRYGGRWHR